MHGFFSVICTAIHMLYGVAVHSRTDVDSNFRNEELIGSTDRN